jgi:hypothetical protein
VTDRREVLAIIWSLGESRMASWPLPWALYPMYVRDGVERDQSSTLAQGPRTDDSGPHRILWLLGDLIIEIWIPATWTVACRLSGRYNLRTIYGVDGISLSIYVGAYNSRTPGNGAPTVVIPILLKSILHLHCFLVFSFPTAILTYIYNGANCTVLPICYYIRVWTCVRP